MFQISVSWERVTGEYSKFGDRRKLLCLDGGKMGSACDNHSLSPSAMPRSSV